MEADHLLVLAAFLAVFFAACGYAHSIPASAAAHPVRWAARWWRRLFGRRP